MSAAGGEQLHPAGLPIRLMQDRCLVMGVLNVTPDSFSDGGRFWDTGRARTSPEQDTIQAVEHGLRLAESGADIVDVGGESTRPGAERITVDEEIRRVVPVVSELASAGICVSVDTMRATTAESALAAGATLVNDVSGGLADPDMLATVAQYEGPYVLMHWRGHSTEMSDRATYGDVVNDVLVEINERVEAALAAGIAGERLVIDPGLGFAKEAVHNWALLRGLGDLPSTGLPVLVGASRKRFLGELLADDRGPRPVSERESATVAVSTLAAMSGAWCLRVHDVAPSADAVRVVKAWRG
jgi:dihydropteroate synthase